MRVESRAARLEYMCGDAIVFNHHSPLMCDLIGFDF